MCVLLPALHQRRVDLAEEPLRTALQEGPALGRRYQQAMAEVLSAGGRGLPIDDVTVGWGHAPGRGDDDREIRAGDVVRHGTSFAEAGTPPFVMVFTWRSSVTPDV